MVIDNYAYILFIGIPIVMAIIILITFCDCGDDRDPYQPLIDNSYRVLYSHKDELDSDHPY